MKIFNKKSHETEKHKDYQIRKRIGDAEMLVRIKSDIPISDQEAENIAEIVSQGQQQNIDNWSLNRKISDQCEEKEICSVATIGDESNGWLVELSTNNKTNGTLSE